MKTQINNNPKNLEKIKLDSIRLEILYRSLYILKKIEKEKENDIKEKENEQKEYEEKKYYLERTFLFYLYKNSKLKMIDENLFDSELKAHPATLKF